MQTNESVSPFAVLSSLKGDVDETINNFMAHEFDKERG